MFWDLRPSTLDPAAPPMRLSKNRQGITFVPACLLVNWPRALPSRLPRQGKESPGDLITCYQIGRGPEMTSTIKARLAIEAKSEFEPGTGHLNLGNLDLHDNVS